MDQEQERKRKFLINAAYYSLILAIIYISFRYVIYFVTPFVIAALITFMLKRPIDNFSRSFNLPRRGTAGLMVILFYATTSILLTWGVIHVFWTLFNWMSDIPSRYANNIEPAIENLLKWYEARVASLAPNSVSYLEQLSTDILGKISEIIVYISKQAIILAQSLALSIPTFIIGAVFCIVATVFMSLDFPRIKHFILNQFTYENQRILLDSKRYIVQTFQRILTSYALIMFITMTELYFGLTVIGIKDAMGLSLLIAMFDILPALGTGGIMIPWILIEMLNQNYNLSLQLLIIYVIITLVRNFIEPKIVGNSIGLHPVLMLMSIFLGVSIFGVLGILIMPFMLIVLKRLNDSGRIHIFNSSYSDDKEEPGFFELKLRAKLKRQARREKEEVEEVIRKEKRAQYKAAKAANHAKFVVFDKTDVSKSTESDKDEKKD